MITNKNVLMLLGLAVVIVGYFGTLDWNTLWPSGAGDVLIVIGLAKAVLAYLMPPTSQQNVAATGNFFFTHT
jgi:hypothetical protein